MFESTVVCPAMAQQPMSQEEWATLQNLLDRAQRNGMVGSALQTIGVDEVVSHWVDGEIERSLQQPVVRPAAKAKAASTHMYVGSQEAIDLGGYEFVDAGSSMTDASKRLHDAVEDASSTMETATPAAAIPQRNRTVAALAPVNTEACIATGQTREQFTMIQNRRVTADGAQVAPQALTVAEALDRSNPSIALRDAQRMYPSIALVDDVDRGLPTYTHTFAPPGPVRELWHVQHPLNDNVPMPNGVATMEEWGRTMLTMQKYSGKTFEDLLDGIKRGNKDMIQYCSWLVHTYSKNISTQPKSQAPDLAAYLLRSGFDPDERASVITYTRTYASHRPA